MTSRKTLLKRVLYLLFAGLMLGAASVACQFGTSEPAISETFMATDEDGEEQTTVFAQDDTIYAFVIVNGGSDDTVTEAIWKVQLAQGVEPDVEIETQTLEGGGRLIFSLFNEQPWPVGSYAVEIYLNEELTETLEFEVQ